MKIYIDADASPVQDIVINEAEKFNVPVVVIKSYNHFSHDEDMAGVRTIYVDPGADAADYEIIKLAHRGDLIITHDYGLASLGLAKGCQVLHHKGFAYSNKNIDMMLESRHLSAKARKAGQKTKGPKAFTDEDRLKFRKLLKHTLEETQQD